MFFISQSFEEQKDLIDRLSKLQVAFAPGEPNRIFRCKRVNVR